ncbi:hypothetical protein CAEBREN_14316 [Caenorhabditis brenneri]|uniref:Uncharacterized protein n=1 Tax=Caenorhabditis brenneri TaxID=135651 RepID=G0NNA3_CAEBE|nr:hypothetical protein CAEBREN_14316 [Caenorhabditis brenneri]
MSLVRKKGNTAVFHYLRISMKFFRRRWNVVPKKTDTAIRIAFSSKAKKSMTVELVFTVS